MGIQVQFWEKFLGIDLKNLLPQMQKLSLPQTKITEKAD